MRKLHLREPGDEPLSTHKPPQHDHSTDETIPLQRRAYSATLRVSLSFKLLFSLYICIQRPTIHPHRVRVGVRFQVFFEDVSN